MSVRTANYTASGTAQQLFPPGTGSGDFNNVEGTLSEPISVAVTNEDSTDAIRIGEEDVISASAGFLVAAGTTWSADFVDGDMVTLYMVTGVADSTPAVSVIATRQNA